MVGGYMWGYLADQRGRRRVLVMSLSVNSVFGALASGAPSFWLFLLLRFISGIGVGGSISGYFLILIQGQQKENRVVPLYKADQLSKVPIMIIFD